MHPLRTIIRRFDHWLSNRLHVQEFTTDPQVIMRIQLRRSPHDLALPAGNIPKGTAVLCLHMWNERAPIIPDEGPDLAWARHTQRMMVHSLQAVAEYILSQPDCKEIQAIGGITAHVSLQQADGGRTMLEHLGFTIFPYYRPAGAFGEFWENFLTWWLMWTFNPASVRHRKIWHLQRVEFWMSRGDFLQKYAQILKD